MNVKPHSINPVATGLQRKPFSLIVIAGLFSIGVLSLIQENNAAESNAIAQTVSIAAPTQFAIQSLSITGTNTGTTTIVLDDFILNVQFTFEAHPDSYGIPGSEYTAVEITELKEINITTTSGDAFSDFTDANDHYNINQLITAYIEKNNLVEVVS